ncbi:MAG: hypothetical protein U5J98_01805 [Halobacteriales archaeon]|nr:hypothetical protein [Halobacteriales archaeon]
MPDRGRVRRRAPGDRHGQDPQGRAPGVPRRPRRVSRLFPFVRPAPPTEHLTARTARAQP